MQITQESFSPVEIKGEEINPIAWLAEHSEEVKRAQELLSIWKKMESAIKTHAKQMAPGQTVTIHQTEDTVKLAFIEYSAPKSGFQVNQSLIHALMTSPDLVNGRRDRLKQLFQPVYTSKKGGAIKVRKECDELVEELQAEGFAGKYRQESPEKSFVAQPAAAPSCSLKLV